MDLFPTRFDMKELLVFLVALIIHTAILSILDYGYGVRFASDAISISLKVASLLFVVYLPLRLVYVRLNLGRFLK